MARYVCMLQMPDELKQDSGFDAEAYARETFDWHLSAKKLEKNEPWRFSWTMQRSWYEDRYRLPKRAYNWLNVKVLWRLGLDTQDRRTYHCVNEWIVRGITDVGPPAQEIPYTGITRPTISGPVPDDRDINWADFMTGDNDE